MTSEVIFKVVEIEEKSIQKCIAIVFTGYHWEKEKQMHKHWWGEKKCTLRKTGKSDIGLHFILEDVACNF